jgi:branched-chain amino acid transport system ATP-binding protein
MTPPSSMPIWVVSSMLLEVRNLEVAYGDYQVVWGVSLSIAAGESVALLGPNGSGKSTVVNTISGLLAAKAGDIRFDGASLQDRPTHVRAGLGIAHVLERRRVFPHLSVLQNLMLGAWHAAAKAARARTLERVFALFPRLSECKSQLARTLSGGEQQMLALGRGLMALPRLLMVDEPFLGLAPRVVEQMKSVFETLQAEGIAILFIEQNVRLALSMAGRGYVLESGRLAIEGDASTLIDSPEVRRIFLGG